jgi:hypothetical protein
VVVLLLQILVTVHSSRGVEAAVAAAVAAAAAVVVVVVMIRTGGTDETVANETVISHWCSFCVHKGEHIHAYRA